jgi:putative redox protein
VQGWDTGGNRSRYEKLLSCVVVRTPFRARPDGVPAGHEQATSREMSLTATARSIPGTLRQEVVIDGQHRIITDEPQRLGGEGSGPAPHELFPAALAACVSTTLVMYARTKEWELGEVAVEVDYDHRSTPRRFQIAIRLSGDVGDEQLERLNRVARACPLRRSIEVGIEFLESIERREGASGREPVTTGGAA